MNKYPKNKLRAALSPAIVAMALAAIVVAGGCASDDNNKDAWQERDTRPARASAAPKSRPQRGAHLRYVLSQVVLIRMNKRGELCIGEDDSVVIQPKDFSAKIRAIGREFPGKPVLFYIDEEAANAQPEIAAYVRRECRRANLGKFYFDIPDDI